MGTLAGNVASYPSQDKKPEAEKEILHRILGKTGIKIPIVSMGVMNAFSPELVRRSYEKGIRYFDTSSYYQRGKNEEMIGNVTQQLNVRKEVIIATKVYLPHAQRSMPPDQVKAYFLRSSDESLKRLQTDYVDILFSHSVSELTWLNNPGVRDALQLIKKQGKARFIGFSTHQNMAECIDDAAQSGLYDVILTMFNYALWDDLNLLAALKNAQAKNIGLIAMKTQCPQYGGHWENVPDSKMHYYKGKIMHSAVLKWVLRHQFIATAIPGLTTFQQIDDDFPVAYNLDYTDEEKKFLDDRNASLSFGYCRQCSECTRQCQMGVDIPTLMRVHMYSVCYNNFHHARQTLDDIPISQSLRNCASCQHCSVQCRRGIDVADRINELQVIYG